MTDFCYLSAMKANILDLFEVFKRTMPEEDAGLVVRYMEDTNEAEVVRTVERKMEYVPTGEDLANLRAEIKESIANLRAEIKTESANAKAHLIKWLFLFWAGQLGVLFGFLHYFSK